MFCGAPQAGHSCCIAALGRPPTLAAAKSPPDWHSSTGQRSGPRTSVVYPQQQQQPHTDPPKSQAPVGAARPRYATAQATQSRKTTRPRTRSPPPRTTQNARLAAESPREIAGPAGRRRRRANAASKPPSHTDASRAELSPRNLPVGVAVAIGPSRKPGSSSAGRDCEHRSLPTSTQRWCKALSQLLFLAKNQLRCAKASLRPPKSSRASRCQRLCESHKRPPDAAVTL